MWSEKMANPRSQFGADSVLRQYLIQPIIAFDWNNATRLQFFPNWWNPNVMHGCRQNLPIPIVGGIFLLAMLTNGDFLQWTAEVRFRMIFSGNFGD